MMKSVYADEKLCCGCSACSNACPSGAIAMRMDKRGFSYPTIDREKCTDSSCRNCVAVCPMMTEKRLSAVSDPVLVDSPAGNALAAISDAMLEMGGVVFCSGPVHATTTSAIYEEAIRALREGGSVLFIGTPCETAGMRGLMKRKVYPKNLYTCDTACSGQDTTLRPSCRTCPFSDDRRSSDISVAGHVEIGEYTPGSRDAKGASLILVNSAKGQALFEAAKADLPPHRCPAEELSA